MSRSSPLAPRFVAAQIFLAVLVSCGTVIVVDDPAAGIARALAACSDGDTIQVRAGTYSGPGNCDLVVTKNRLTLVGVSGASGTVMDCRESRCLSVLGSGFSVSGFTFVNGVAPNTVGHQQRQSSGRRER